MQTWRGCPAGAVALERVEKTLAGLSPPTPPSGVSDLQPEAKGTGMKQCARVQGRAETDSGKTHGELAHDIMSIILCH